MTIKDSRYVKMNFIYPLYLIIGKANEYFEKVNKNRYLTLVPTSESKEIIKKFEEL